MSLRHRGDVAHLGRADELVAGRHPQPGRDHRGARGAVRDQRRRLAEHPPDAGHPRHGRLHRAVVPLGPLARRPRPHREAVRARRRRRVGIPDRTDHRRHRRAAHDLPADDPVDAAEPAVPRPGAAGRPVGDAAPAVLRPLVPVRHALPGHRDGDRGLPDRPGVPRGSEASPSTRRTSCDANS